MNLFLKELFLKFALLYVLEIMFAGFSLSNFIGERKEKMNSGLPD